MLNQASLDMEYNFGTETQGGSNNETNLSFSNSCETMCAAFSFRVGLPLSPLRPVEWTLRCSTAPKPCGYGQGFRLEK